MVLDLSYLTEQPSESQEQAILEAVNEACLIAIIQYLTEMADAMVANNIPALNEPTIRTPNEGSTMIEDTFMTPPINQSAMDIAATCDGLKELLLEKNRKYGDAALSPLRVFSKADPVEQIKVRLDDKLSRLANQQNDEDEDVIQDLLGYLILLRIAQKRNVLASMGMVQ